MHLEKHCVKNGMVKNGFSLIRLIQAKGEGVILFVGEGLHCLSAKDEFSTCVDGQITEQFLDGMFLACLSALQIYYITGP